MNASPTSTDGSAVARAPELRLRRCPVCGGEGATVSRHVDPDAARYGLAQRPVSLRRCRRCAMRYFDLLEGVNTGGEIYAALALAAPRVRPRHRLLARVLAARHRHGSSGLDLGCGASHVSRLLPATHRVTAVDRSPRSADAPEHVQFVDADILALADRDLPAAGFDWILLDNVLEHLPRFDALLAHCAHWLAPGGRVIVCVPNGDTLKQYLGGRHRREVHRPVEHVNVFTRRTLDRALAGAGLRPRAHPILPRSLFEAGVAASLLGWAPFGLYRAYGA